MSGKDSQCYNDEAPTMQLSNSTILTGSPAYSMVGDVVANDVDSDNSKLSYRIGDRLE
jgi:hypothetical protein